MSKMVITTGDRMASQSDRAASFQASGRDWTAHMPHLLHAAAIRIARLSQRTGRGRAKARILELLAGHSVLDLRTIAEDAHVSVTRARALVERLELRGEVLLQTTRTGGMIVRVLTP
jgi:hypothetical protein